jgi:hypothetical protein
MDVIVICVTNVEAYGATTGYLMGFANFPQSAVVAPLLRRGAGPQFGLGPALFITSSPPRLWRGT